MKKNQILQSLEYLKPRSFKNLASKVSFLLEEKLWAKMLTGMVLGLIFGHLISPHGFFGESLSGYTSEIQTFLKWLTLPSQLFLKTIQMVIVPLIIASIIRGLASTEDISQLKNLGMKFGLFVFVTSALSSSLGVIISTIFRPGRFLDYRLFSSPPVDTEASLMLKSLSPETILKIIPMNPIESIVQGQMLEVVLISIIGGIALLSIELKESRIVLDLLEVTQSICMAIIAWAMKIAPFAIFGMMTSVAASTGLKALQSMGFYLITVYTGFILFIFFYGIVILLFKRISPLKFFVKISSPMLLAFSTSSSAASMPITLKVAEEELDISNSTANFLIPLGATINMAGTAIWQTTAVIFLSQVYKIDLSTGELFFVIATSLGSAVGSPGVPGVGMGILAVILSKVGIPIEGVGLVLGFNRVVDMGCTVVNVVGDLTAAKLFDKNGVT